jgi:hypothetical protein
VTVRCEAFAILGVKSQQWKYLSIGDKEKGKTETPTGKARLSCKQALRLWSGFVELRMPTAPLLKISIIRRISRAAGM